MFEICESRIKMWADHRQDYSALNFSFGGGENLFAGMFSGSFQGNIGLLEVPVSIDFQRFRHSCLNLALISKKKYIGPNSGRSCDITGTLIIRKFA
jgi:hypothetical protein